MNRTKRTVAAFLTAATIITSFAACNKQQYEDSEEYKQLESETLNDVNQFIEENPKSSPSSANYDKLIYYSIYHPEDGNWHMWLVFYDKTNSKFENYSYWTVEYLISEEDAMKFDIHNDIYNNFYPFENKDSLSKLCSLIKKYEPLNIEKLNVGTEYLTSFDEVVNEYCK